MLNSIKGIPHRPMASLWLPICLLIFAIGTDQLTKIAASRILAHSGDIPLLGGLVKFSLIENHEDFFTDFNSIWNNNRRKEFYKGRT